MNKLRDNTSIILLMLMSLFIGTILVYGFLAYQNREQDSTLTQKKSRTKKHKYAATRKEAKPETTKTGFFSSTPSSKQTDSSVTIPGFNEPQKNSGYSGNLSKLYRGEPNEDPHKDLLSCKTPTLIPVENDTASKIDAMAHEIANQDNDAEMDSLYQHKKTDPLLKNFKNPAQEKEESISRATTKFGCLFEINSDNFLAAASNVGLLNSRQSFDQALFFQTIINMPCSVILPARDWGRTDFNITPRINMLWGNGELGRTSKEFIKVGRAVTESKRAHTFEKPIVWLRETWIKLHSPTEQSSFQIGFFPKQIGLGLVLGNSYKMGQVLLLSNEEKFVDQYRPGIQLATQFGNTKHYDVSCYYSLYNNNATSLDHQVEFTQSQELSMCGDGPPFAKIDHASRPLMQASHLLAAEMDIPINVTRGQETATSIHVKPFIMYNKDHNQMVEFAGDAESSLFSIGACCTLQTKKFKAFVDIAGNFGSQDIKAWDRNLTEQHARMALTHLFTQSYADMDNPNLPINNLITQSGTWVISPTFPYPYDIDISTNYDAGEEFQNEDPDQIIYSYLSPPSQSGDPVNLNFKFKNSYSRFRRCYSNTYRAFMFAADCGYEISKRHELGFILGYATGDDSPNDTQEKAYLYRLRTDWNVARKDRHKDYRGFQGIQSLYTGKFVRSMHLLRAQKLNNPLSQVEETTANEFTNLVYGGLGFWWNKEYKSGSMRFNTNMIAMGQASSLLFDFDPVLQDIYQTYDYQQDASTTARFASNDQRLSQFLGIEFNAFFEFFTKNSLTFYGMLTVFVPGSYYHDIACLSYMNYGKHARFKNQRDALSQDQSGFESIDNMKYSLLDNTSVAVYIGVKFDFDTISLHHNPFKSKRRKKNKVTS